MTKTVPELMRQAADVFEERARAYGDNYKRFGKVMMAIFPNGITLANEGDWNRMGIWVQVMSKTTRYAENFVRGGHDDSLLDMSVYANMLREIELGLAPDTDAPSLRTDIVRRAM